MHFEEFAEGASPLHRMDPRVKVVSLAAYAVVTAVGMDMRASAAALALSCILAVIARLPVKKLFIRLVVVNAFIVLLWVMLPFSTPGEAVFEMGRLTATRQGLDLALLITLKTNAIIIATISLLGTSSIFTLAHSLVHLHMPTKLVQLFFFTYRYISVLHTEYTKLRSAMKIRCFKARSNMHTYRSYAYLIGMLFVRSFERSERIQKAMLCRGFKGEFKTLHHFVMRPVDAVALVVFMLVSGCLAAWNLGAFA